MNRKRPVKMKVYARSVVAILLIIVWSLIAITGVLLWLAPSGRRSGQIELLFGLTKGEWGDVHFWIGVATLVITFIHVVIDWRALRGVIRYLIATHRESGITQN